MTIASLPFALRHGPGRAVLAALAAMLGLDVDDLAEVELATDGLGATFATDAPDRPPSADPLVGVMVDAYNVLTYGYLPRIATEPDR